jgi:hypothetical protein
VFISRYPHLLSTSLCKRVKTRLNRSVLLRNNMSKSRVHAKEMIQTLEGYVSVMERELAEVKRQEGLLRARYKAASTKPDDDEYDLITQQCKYILAGGAV